MGEASLTRGSTAAAPPAVMHLHQPIQASNPFICVTESHKHGLAPGAQVLALGNNPQVRRPAALAPHYACTPSKEGTYAL